ncbi:DUF2785 domain-containing protein [Dictyobacter arantiisoli]|uniref:Membrane protein n=1 Tax=Dictyobacter arantiisoli TaxID=2014874 RepID=A0A5A5T7M3_9CHLR|nr:DUF2785 domain-containing protein [Dictyobacter arantiisoli]GCF07206.1 membrane protein [Dictyobacter arantiisoli]
MQDVTVQATNKEFLNSIANNDYELPADIDPFAFAQALLANLASPDAELRDELSCLILAGGIIDKQRLSTEQLEQLLLLTIDQEHLFYHIGEKETDAVFMRSFSCLIIASILFNDARSPLFKTSLVQQSKEKLLRYAQEEKDWRGFVEGKGWAHAMAHLADALDQCAQHPYMTSEDRQEILTVISQLIPLSEPLYHEEDIRLAKIAYHVILGHQVNEAFIAEWLKMCSVERDPDVIAWTRITNAKNVLRSLYFLLQWDNIAPLVVEQISQALRKQDEIYLEKLISD